MLGKKSPGQKVCKKCSINLLALLGLKPQIKTYIVCLCFWQNVVFIAEHLQREQWRPCTV